MRRVLLVCALAGILVVAGGVGLLNGGADQPDPAQPNVDPAVLLQLRGDDLAATVATLQDHLRAQPADGRGWATLGLAYVEMARLSGDASFYPKADAALGRSLDLTPVDNDLALAGQAALAAARHEFSLALRHSRAALAVNPYQPQALAVQVDALTELGRYRAQLTALAQADRRQPGVPVFARYSYAAELRGHLGRAEQLLRRALEGTSSSADRAYLLTLLADLERLSGHLRSAQDLLREALRQSPEYVPALASRARLAVARGDLTSAEVAWEDVTSRLPLPEYLIELGELQTATGHPDLAAQQFSLLEATETLLRSNGVRTDLETALYEADHGAAAAALRTARSEWSRRNSVHVADALGWALHVNDKDTAALRLAVRATRLDTPVATFWIHRGLIEESLGRSQAAESHLRRGLALDPGLSPWQAERARDALHRLVRSR